MTKKNFIKKQDQSEAEEGFVFVKIYGEGKDENDQDVKYFIREEKIEIKNLENLIAREEERLAQDIARAQVKIDELKDKLNVVKGV